MILCVRCTSKGDNVFCVRFMSKDVILCARFTSKGDAVYCVGFMSKGVILCIRCTSSSDHVLRLAQEINQSMSDKVTDFLTF